MACDRYGAIHSGREDYESGSMNTPKRWLAENTNADRRDGSPREVIEGTDLFIGLSGPGIIDAQDLERMNPDPFVFAMANPNPEVRPEEAAPYVRVMATGRSDYPNQINNVLAFPGIFRGALDVRATGITEEMKLAAAKGIASVVADEELDEDYIVPSVFNRDVSHAVAAAVAEEAERTGSSRAAGRDADQPTVESAASSSPTRRSHVKVAVTGATGTDRQRARARARGARRRGHGAVALAREGVARASASTRSRWADPLSEPAPAEALAGRDAVVHLRASRSPSAGATTPSARSATRACSARATSSPASARSARTAARARSCPSRPAATTAPAGTSASTSPPSPATTSWPRSTAAWEAEARAAEEPRPARGD